MSLNKLRLKKGDTVIVISGAQKGTIGRIIEVSPADRKLRVEGVRVVKRHTKPAGDRQGGIITKEAFIDVSNVAYYDRDASQRIKVGYAVQDGKKVRVDRKRGTVLDKE